MAGDTVEALCGACKIALEGPANANDQDMFSCPQCGRSGTRKDVIREIGKHAKEIIARGLQESLRTSTRGSEFLKLDSKRIPKRSYRFISNIKL